MLIVLIVFADLKLLSQLEILVQYNYKEIFFIH